LTVSNLAHPDEPNASAWRTYTTTHGLADNYVTAIAIDPAGHKWFGTHVGLSEFDGQDWRTYTTADGLADNHIAAIAIDPTGLIWVGTANGLSEFDGQSWRTYTTTHGLPHNSITAIAIDPAGLIWVGTYGSGVSEFDGQSWRTYTTADGLAHNQVKAIATDSAGHKWFATFGAAQFEGAGVSEFDGQSWRTYTTADGLAHNWVNTIVVDAAGHKWFGTEGGGVSKFDGATWTTYTAADGLAGNVVYAIDLDQTGDLWFGTSGGLSKLALNEDKAWTSYTKRDGLPHQPVYSLAIDQAGRKWLDYSQVGFFIDIAGSPVFPFEGGGGGVSVFDDQEWSPTPTVLPVVVAIPVTPTQSFRLDEFSPRLIDAESGRIYTIGYVEGIDKPQTLVLNLADERLLARYDLAGGLALDETHDRLYIDQYQNAGLAVLNTRTGQLERIILLPGRDDSGSPLPLADPTTGRVLAFRHNVVYLADPERAAIIDTIAFEVINYVQEVAPIERPLYDPTAHLLYLTFTIHGCTSSMSGDCSTRKVVVYDLAAGREVTCNDNHLGAIVGSYSFSEKDFELSPAKDAIISAQGLAILTHQVGNLLGGVREIAQFIIDFVDQVLEGGEVAQRGGSLFDVAPEILNGIEVRRVGGQLMNRIKSWLLSLWLPAKSQTRFFPALPAGLQPHQLDGQRQSGLSDRKSPASLTIPPHRAGCIPPQNGCRSNPGLKRCPSRRNHSLLFPVPVQSVWLKPCVGFCSICQADLADADTPSCPVA
jgi:hypothetical protein